MKCIFFEKKPVRLRGRILAIKPVITSQEKRQTHGGIFHYCKNPFLQCLNRVEKVSLIGQTWSKKRHLLHAQKKSEIFFAVNLFIHTHWKKSRLSDFLRQLPRKSDFSVAKSVMYKLYSLLQKHFPPQNTIENFKLFISERSLSRNLINCYCNCWMSSFSSLH